MSAFFVFVYRLAISPKLALLAIGHGSAAEAGYRQSLQEAAAALRVRAGLDKADLEAIADPMAYDYWLAQQSRLFAPAAVDVVGLSLHNPAVREVGGGVIGSPRDKLLAAKSQTEFITPDICTLAFPGGPGVALIGVAPDQAGGFAAAIKVPEARTQNCGALLAAAAETPARAAIVIFDSCGTRQTGGGFYIRDVNDKKIYELPGSCLEGDSYLDIFPYSRI